MWNGMHLFGGRQTEMDVELHSNSLELNGIHEFFSVNWWKHWMYEYIHNIANFVFNTMRVEPT